MSAYSHKPPSSTPSEPSNSFLPALRHIQYFEMVENVKYGEKKEVRKSSCQVPFNSLSHPTLEQTLFQAGGVLTMSGPFTDICSNILNTGLSHHHPPLSHCLCPTEGLICVLWPTPSPAPLSHPNLSVTDRTDLSCSNPPPCQ